MALRTSRDADGLEGSKQRGQTRSKPATGGRAVRGPAGCSQDPEEPTEPTKHTERGSSTNGFGSCRLPPLPRRGKTGGCLGPRRRENTRITQAKGMVPRPARQGYE